MKKRMSDDTLEVKDSAVKVLGEPTLKRIVRKAVVAVRRSVTIDWTMRKSSPVRVIVCPILHQTRCIVLSPRKLSHPHQPALWPELFQQVLPNRMPLQVQRPLYRSDTWPRTVP